MIPKESSVAFHGVVERLEHEDGAVGEAREQGGRACRTQSLLAHQEELARAEACAARAHADANQMHAHHEAVRWKGDPHTCSEPRPQADARQDVGHVRTPRAMPEGEDVSKVRI